MARRRPLLRRPVVWVLALVGAAWYLGANGSDPPVVTTKAPTRLRDTSAVAVDNAGTSAGAGASAIEERIEGSEDGGAAPVASADEAAGDEEAPAEQVDSEPVGDPAVGEAAPPAPPVPPSPAPAAPSASGTPAPPSPSPAATPAASKSREGRTQRRTNTGTASHTISGSLTPSVPPPPSTPSGTGSAPAPATPSGTPPPAAATGTPTRSSDSTHTGTPTASTTFSSLATPTATATTETTAVMRARLAREWAAAHGGVDDPVHGPLTPAERALHDRLEHPMEPHCNASWVAVITEYAAFHKAAVARIAAGERDVPKMVVYRCEELPVSEIGITTDCGGFADRLAGMAHVFLLALYYKWVFLADWRGQAEVFNSPFFDYTWRPEYEARRATSNFNFVSCPGQGDYRDCPLGVPDPESLYATPVNFISTNRGGLRWGKPDRVARFFEWGLDKWTQGGCVYRALLKPTPPMLEDIKPTALALLDPTYQWIAMHRRTGDRQMHGLVEDVLFKVEGDDYWQCVLRRENVMKNETHGTRPVKYFLVTDSLVRGRAGEGAAQEGLSVGGAWGAPSARIARAHAPRTPPSVTTDPTPPRFNPRSRTRRRRWRTGGPTSCSSQRRSPSTSRRCRCTGTACWGATRRCPSRQSAWRARLATGTCCRWCPS
jgi:hypothetical protein